MNKTLIKQIILPLFVLMVVIQIWSSIPHVVEGFPSPSETYASAFGGVDVDEDEVILLNALYVEDEEEKGIFWHLIESLKKVFGGFALALILGIPLGLLIGMSDNTHDAFSPFIKVFKTVSPLAWLPLLLFIFKDGEVTAIALIFITSIWTIITNTALGVRSVSEDYMNVARVLQFTSTEKVVQVILPVAVPFIFRGMRLALALSWLVIVAIEMLTEGIGIGFWIWNAYNESEFTHVIIALILIGVVGFILDAMMGKIIDYFDYSRKGEV